MASPDWKIWNTDTTQYGQLLYRRAIGELDEMESAKAACEVLRRIYRPGLTVADVGCGAGHYLRSLRARLDPAVAYTGIDATPAYVDLARQAFPEDAEFLLGDIHALPVEDQAFDIVMNNNVLLHLPPPPRRAIAELIRIARRHVVIRAPFGERNYVIQELRMSDAALAEIESDGAPIPAGFNYFNLYTEGYYRAVIAAIDPTIAVEIVRDDMWQSFNNTELTTPTGTRVHGDRQVSGNVLLDWRFLVLTKPLPE